MIELISTYGNAEIVRENQRMEIGRKIGIPEF
jgi:hypothetical protein